jgi:hypothetical protein
MPAIELKGIVWTLVSLLTALGVFREKGME